MQRAPRHDTLMDMKLISTTKPVKVQLARNLVKNIKRGHAWVYADSLRQIPDVSPGTPAILLDNRGGREIARGYLDPSGPIALRICSTQPGVPLSDHWAEKTMQRALMLRRTLFPSPKHTNAFRLFNGEGDGLPGLVCDIYSHAAVLVTDGRAPEGFWQVDQVARWLVDSLGVSLVYHKSRGTHATQTSQIFGPDTDAPIFFEENGLHFTVSPISGQKTGFFLDQRENRAAIQPLSAGKTVLNMFGYTGGFSVYAGRGGAEHVTTVDIAQPALQEAIHHWQYNQLPEEKHRTDPSDGFEFLTKAVQAGQQWDLVILDPPSFAPSEASIPQAENAYRRLYALGAQVTSPGGRLAAASCSSHISQEHFLRIVQESLSDARRTAFIQGLLGQPQDHPSPLVMPELRYLKFLIMQLD